MSTLRVQIDVGDVLRRHLTELELTQVPFATMQAINTTAFETRQRWAEVMPRIFDRPTPLTMNAVLYRKASKAKLEADIYIRDEAFKGTPPAKYLRAQVEGGPRHMKSFEKRLNAAGILPIGMFVVPGRGAVLDRYGNIPGSQLTAILSAVGAQHDRYQNASGASRKRRRGRGKRGGEYFALKTRHGKLKPGVYERIETGFGSAVRSILHFVRAPHYRKRYDIFGMATTIFNRRYPEIFKAELQRAVESTWARNFS
jgi:hypothetical protein